MSKQMVALTCNTCGKGFKCREDYLGRILEGSAKCPHCGMTLQPDRKSLRWESDDTAWGEPLETRNNALLRVARHKGTAIATFTVPRVCELPQIAQLDEELRDLVEKYEIKHVVLDFAPLGFMSSSVISVLVRFQTMVKAAGGALVLCSMPEPIDEVFKVMHLHKHFNVQKDQRDALKALKKQP